MQTNSTIDMDTALTLEKLMQKVMEIFPILWYIEDKNTKKENWYLLKPPATKFEVIITHPENVDKLKKSIFGRTLKNLKEDKERYADSALLPPYPFSLKLGFKNIDDAIIKLKLNKWEET